MATASKQAARNREILIASASGDTAKQIAARHDLTATRVRQIISAEAPVLADAGAIEPAKAALERRAQYEAIYEDAVAYFERIPDSDASPKVGALRLALNALDRLSTWDQVIGVIPGNLALANDQIEFVRILEVVLETIETAGVKPEVFEMISENIEQSKRTA